MAGEDESDEFTMTPGEYLQAVIDHRDIFTPQERPLIQAAADDAKQAERLREALREAAEWREFYKTTLVRLRQICPCGGIILADTEDFEVPLCDECYSASEEPQCECTEYHGGHMPGCPLHQPRPDDLPTHVHVHQFPDGGMVGEVLPGSARHCRKEGACVLTEGHPGECVFGGEPPP